MFICLFTVVAKFCKDYVIASERMDVTIHFVPRFKCIYNIPREGRERGRNLMGVTIHCTWFQMI